MPIAGALARDERRDAGDRAEVVEVEPLERDAQPIVNLELIQQFHQRERVEHSARDEIGIERRHRQVEAFHEDRDDLVVQRKIDQIGVNSQDGLQPSRRSGSRGR